MKQNEKKKKNDVHDDILSSSWRFSLSFSNPLLHSSRRVCVSAQALLYTDVYNKRILFITHKHVHIRSPVRAAIAAWRAKIYSSSKLTRWNVPWDVPYGDMQEKNVIANQSSGSTLPSDSLALSLNAARESEEISSGV